MFSYNSVRLRHLDICCYRALYSDGDNVFLDFEPFASDIVQQSTSTDLSQTTKSTPQIKPCISFKYSNFIKSSDSYNYLLGVEHRSLNSSRSPFFRLDKLKEALRGNSLALLCSVNSGWKCGRSLGYQYNNGGIWSCTW